MPAMRVLVGGAGEGGRVVAANDLGRRCPERQVRVDRRREPDVVSRLLREVPLLLEDIAIRLDDIA